MFSLCLARSEVFKRMFASNMKEMDSNRVEIMDFDDVIVGGMLEYIYKGQVDILSERAPDLLQIAEKYELQGLKEICEFTIAKHLTVENAAEVLVIAHIHNAALLKATVIDFINRNKEDVRKTNGFRRVAAEKPEIFVDLYLSQ